MPETQKREQKVLTKRQAWKSPELNECIKAKDIVITKKRKWKVIGIAFVIITSALIPLAYYLSLPPCNTKMNLKIKSDGFVQVMNGTDQIGVPNATYDITGFLTMGVYLPKEDWVAALASQNGDDFSDYLEGKYGADYTFPNEVTMFSVANSTGGSFSFFSTSGPRGQGFSSIHQMNRLYVYVIIGFMVGINATEQYGDPGQKYIREALMVTNPDFGVETDLTKILQGMPKWAVIHGDVCATHTYTLKSVEYQTGTWTSSYWSNAKLSKGFLLIDGVAVTVPAE